MAQIKNTTRGIDTTLEHTTRAWAVLPEVADEISGWEPVERIDFIYDWAVEETKLRRLRRQAEDGLMDEAQIGRFRALENLVEQNRPIIEKLKGRYNS